MAAARQEFATLETWAISTLVDDPDAASHLVGWYMDGTWVATVPVRRADEPPVFLMAVPGECISSDSLPLAPVGGVPTVVVAATAGRVRCKVAFMAVPEEELQDAVATLEMLEEHGHEVAFFGPQQSLEPRERDLLRASIELGYQPRGGEDLWASAASGEDDLGLDMMETGDLPSELAAFQREAEGEWEMDGNRIEASDAHWAEDRGSRASRYAEAEEEAPGVPGGTGDAGYEEEGLTPQGRRPAWGLLPRPNLRLAQPEVALQVQARTLSGRPPASRTSHGSSASGQYSAAAARAQALLGSGPPPLVEVPQPVRARGRGRGTGRQGGPPPGEVPQPTRARGRGQPRMPGGTARTVPRAKVAPAGMPLLDLEDLGEEYTLQGLLRAGIDAQTASQLLLSQSLERFAAAQAPAQTAKKVKVIFGIPRAASEGDDAGDEEDGDDRGRVAGESSAGSSKLKEAMRLHPAEFAKEIRRLAAAALNDEEALESPELILRYVQKEMGIQQQKALGYLTFGLAYVHKALREGKHAEAELLVLSLIAASDQACLDSGWRTAWPMVGLPEPSWVQWAQIDVGLLRRNHGASRLLHDDWVRAEVQRLKDVAYLIRQRAAPPKDWKKPGADGGAPP